MLTPDPALAAWESRQPASLTGDPLWHLNCFRQSLFLLDCVQRDLSSPISSADFTSAREQLFRAVASISANIAEGYGRPSAKDRLRFFSYSLGSAREAAIWYQGIRASVGDETLADRLDRLASVRRMLLGLLGKLREKGGRKFDKW